MNKNLSTFELNIVTQAAHEGNRVWQKLAGDTVDPHWEDLSPEAQQCARNSVIGIVVHDFGAEQTHSAWVAEKHSAGWTHGAKKDAVAKTHPCLVSWHQLPSEQRVKDELWVENVRNFTKNLWRLPQ